MPKRVPPDELDVLVAAARSADGLGRKDAERLLPDLSPRTVLRRLTDLVDEGRLIAVGAGRASRYLPESPDEAGLETDEGGRTLAEPRFSAQALEARRLVGRPRSSRTPTGYQRRLFDDYRPNETWYLPGGLRDKLHTLGRAHGSDRAAGTFARQILDRLLIDLSWASSRLEGNTYSRLDTENLIAFGRANEGKDAVEAQMILNHKRAIEMLVDEAETIGLDRATFQNLHALLAENLMDRPGITGRLRTGPVGIHGSVFEPLADPEEIERRFEQILEQAAAVEDPFEQAFFLMVHLPYLQPFEDVNKRVSRLGANIPLIQANLVPLSFVDVPRGDYIDGTLAVYELNRIELLRDVFAWAYERSCQRYTAIREGLPQPDPLQLRHPDVLIAVVNGIVRDMSAIDEREIERLAGPLVGAQDLGDFKALAINELYQLHEGSLARFRLRPAEFQRWRQLRDDHS